MAEPGVVLPTYPRTAAGWIPTIVTLTRVGFAAVMVAAFSPGSRSGYLLATAMFLAACATDIADGVIARRLGMSSQVGSACDAAADRILCVTALCLLMFAGVVDIRLGLAVIARELVADSVRAWIIKTGDVAPHNMFGRLKFACIAVATIIGLGSRGGLIQTDRVQFAASMLLGSALVFGLVSIAVVIIQAAFRHHRASHVVARSA